MKRIILMITLMLISSRAMSKEESFDLTTAISGVVEKISVEVNQRVKKGELMLTLDQRVIKARLLATEKQLESARLNLAEVQKELERTEELYDRTVISNHELELAKVNFAKAEADFYQAKQSHVQAKYDLEYSQIFAPFDGKVKVIRAWKGMVVNSAQENTVLFTLVK